MRYVLKKARRVIINDIATGKHKVTITEIKKAQLSDGQDVIWAEGANGSRLVGFDQNKTTTLTFESGVVSSGVIEAQTGGTKKTITGGTDILITEEFTLTGSATSVTLANKARGTAGNEIKFIYKEDATGEPDKAFTQGSTASATEFAYAPETKVITLPTGAFADGDVVYVQYKPKFTTYEEIANDADKFSFTGEVFLDAYWTDVCTKEDVPLQLYCPAGKVSGKFDLAFGDAVATQSIEIEALANQCAGKSKNLWTLRNYDLSEIDNA